MLDLSPSPLYGTDIDSIDCFNIHHQANHLANEFPSPSYTEVLQNSGPSASQSLSTHFTAADSLLAPYQPEISLPSPFSVDEVPRDRLSGSTLSDYSVSDVSSLSQNSASVGSRSRDISSPSSVHSRSSSQTSLIQCEFPPCNKVFTTLSAHNHHTRYHIKRWKCPSCPKRQATKREHDRHINLHTSLEKYYCPSAGCSRSEAGGERYFSREDGCVRHMFTKHGIKGGEMECSMDEQTKRIRRERKMRKRKRVA